MFRLRPDLTSNYSLLLASAFISFAIWLIAKQGDLMDEWVTAKIQLAGKMDADIHFVPEEATVFLRFPVWQKSLIDKSSEYTCLIEIQPSALGDPSEWCGVEDFESLDFLLNDSMVVRDDLPSAVQVGTIRPANIKIMGKLRTREVVIQVRTVGKLAEGYHLPKAPRPTASRPNPETLFLTGPEEALDALPRDADGQFYVQAEDIDLGGRDGYFVAKTPLLLPQGVVPAPGYDKIVSFIVGVEEVSAEKEIKKVPIRVQTFSRNVKAVASPEEATVTVEGPRSMIMKLGPGDFSIILKDSPDETAGKETTQALACQWHESVVASVRESVNIIGIEPKSAVIKMIAVDPEDDSGE